MIYTHLYRSNFLCLETDWLEPRPNIEMPCIIHIIPCWMAAKWVFCIHKDKNQIVIQQLYPDHRSDLFSFWSRSDLCGQLWLPSITLHCTGLGLPQGISENISGVLSHIDKVNPRLGEPQDMHKYLQPLIWL